MGLRRLLKGWSMSPITKDKRKKFCYREFYWTLLCSIMGLLGKRGRTMDEKKLMDVIEQTSKIYEKTLQSLANGSTYFADDVTAMKKMEEQNPEIEDCDKAVKDLIRQ